MESGDGLRSGDGWFFERPFSPGDADRLAAEVAAWLGSEHLRWLLENVPGRRAPLQGPEPLAWPSGIAAAASADSGPARLSATLTALGEICDWSLRGTVWDFRPGGGERPLASGGPAAVGEQDVAGESAVPDDIAAAVAQRAAALGLRSAGAPSGLPRTFVVLGGRRAAPLNRARAAAEAIRAGAADPHPVRVLMLCTDRPLDPAELVSPEVSGYAPAARTEVDLMRAAAKAGFGVDPGPGPRRSATADVEVRLAQVPSGPGGRASSYATLRAVAAELKAEGGAVALVTSPTCRPFQYLDGVRALALETGLDCEAFAHPPAWAAEPGTHFARPSIYLQEIRSAIQAAGRLARALSGDGITPLPVP